jgi:hypothetical protein
VLYDSPLEKVRGAGDTSTNLFTWAVCKTAAYDAIHIFGDGRNRFIQVTVGSNILSSCTQQLHCFASSKAMESSSAFNVYFLVVLPSGNTRRFKFELPVGSFSGDWRNIHDQAWDTGAGARDQVQRGTVTWELVVNPLLLPFVPHPIRSLARTMRRSIESSQSCTFALLCYKENLDFMDFFVAATAGSGEDAFAMRLHWSCFSSFMSQPAHKDSCPSFNNMQQITSGW